LVFFQFYADTTNQGATAFCPETGQVCAAQFSVDKGWYRARVDRLLLDGNVRVTYIDYGNAEEISVTGTRSLGKIFTEKPLQVRGEAVGEPGGGEGRRGGWEGDNMIQKERHQDENWVDTKIIYLLHVLGARQQKFLNTQRTLFPLIVRPFAL
jgi:hypothetical protein